MLETNQELLKEWAIKHNMPTPPDAKYLGTSFNGVVKAVVVYCGFYGKSCNVHVSGDGSHWATKDFLKSVFVLPFKKWNLKVSLGDFGPIRQLFPLCRREVLLRHIVGRCRSRPMTCRRLHRAKALILIPCIGFGILVS